jgi:trehalose 6-phosphate synthase/phosphatase
VLQALEMPAVEQEARMTRLRSRVATTTARSWADHFLTTLTARAALPLAPLRDALEGLTAAARLRVIVDYDGCVVPLTTTPSSARPTPAVARFLRALATAPNTDVHIVSGRDRRSLATCLEGIPLSLHAEHGGASRRRGSDVWTHAPVPIWHASAIAFLRRQAEALPGAWVEEKTTTVALHLRCADLGGTSLERLRAAIAAWVAQTPSAIAVAEDHVVELRARGVHKASVLHELLQQRDVADGWLLIGHDTSDEELLFAAPQGAVTIVVGTHPSGARFRLRSAREVCILLARLAEARGREA